MSVYCVCFKCTRLLSSQPQIQEYKRGVEENMEAEAHAAAEDASRFSAEAGGQVKTAAEETLEGALLAVS